MRVLILLTAPLVHANGAEATHRRDDAVHDNRMLTTAPQSVCGAGWNGALLCGTRCPGGTDSECPPGENCFADVDCPLPPTISPKPTRSPVKGFDIGNHEKQIIGYYAGWQWYDRAKLAKPENMDFSKITRVTYAFFQLDTTGNIWGTDEWGDPRILFGEVNPGAGSCVSGQPDCRCSWVNPQVKSCSYHDDSSSLISLVHEAGKEIYPSIGGWTLSDPFPAMAANPTSRATFARNCRDLVEDYDFDGIDLDWEYPGYAAHSGTSADKANFNLLLQDVKRELDDLGTVTGRSYGLTAALPCGPSNINNIDIQTVSQYLTEFNLMSYDFHGSWDTLTGTNSPLYDQSNDPEHGWSVDGCVKNWVNRGAPKERLNIGLAFYGRSFRVAKGLAESHGGADDTNWEVDEGTPQYFNIMEKINSMTIEWDDETKTPIAYFPEGGLISYDDEQSICLKTEYALAEDLNGFIIWELSGDVMDDLNTPLLDILNRKLSEPDTNCADPFGPKLESLTATASVNAGEVSDAAVILPAQTPLATVEVPQASMIVPAQAPSTMAESPGGTTMDLTESEPEPPNATNDSTFSISAVADDPPTFATMAEENPAETTSTSFTTTVAQASASQPSAFEAFTMRTFDHVGRKKVQRENKKPNKPYRPPPKEL